MARIGTLDGLIGPSVNDGPKAVNEGYVRLNLDGE